MARQRSQTANRGGAPEPAPGGHVREFPIVGNVTEKSQDPSPDDRERGEPSSEDAEAPVDIER